MPDEEKATASKLNDALATYVAPSSDTIPNAPKPVAQTTTFDPLQTVNNAPTPPLDAETFVASTRYDALNRPLQIVPPYSDRAASNVPVAVNVIRPDYNQTNLLKRMDVWLALPEEPVEPPDDALAH